MPLDSAGTALPSGSGERFKLVVSAVPLQQARRELMLRPWAALAPNCRPGQAANLRPSLCVLYSWPGHIKAQQRDALAIGDIIAAAFYTCSEAAHAKCTTHITNTIFTRDN